MVSKWWWWSKGILEFPFGPNLGIRLEACTKLNNNSENWNICSLCFSCPVLQNCSNSLVTNFLFFRVSTAVPAQSGFIHPLTDQQSNPTPAHLHMNPLTHQPTKALTHQLTHQPVNPKNYKDKPGRKFVNVRLVRQCLLRQAQQCLLGQAQQ